MSQPQQQPNQPVVTDEELALMNDAKTIWNVVREAGSIICTGSYSYCSNHLRLMAEFDTQMERYKIVLRDSTNASDLLLKKKNKKLIKVELPRFIKPVRPQNDDEVYNVTEPVYVTPKTTKSRVTDYLNKLKSQ